VTVADPLPLASVSPVARTGWLGALCRLVIALVGLELLAALIIYVHGFPYFGSGLVPNAPLWEAPLALLHLPAIEALTAMGLCCGFRNGLVLTHIIRGGHIHMTLAGTAILGLVNWVCWLGIALLGRLLLVHLRSRPTPPRGASSA
jgi:hypothetical protein